MPRPDSISSVERAAHPYRAAPPYVRNRSERNRWRLCVRIAEIAFGEVAGSESVWLMSRALYGSPIPTSDYLPVYVPNPSHPDVAHIDPGSGIVGVPVTVALVRIYYEGNRYGSVNLQRLADRVAAAAGRLRASYPTTARATVPKESLLRVGRYDPAERRIELADEEAKAELCRWLRVDRLDERELKTTNRMRRL